MDWNSEPNGTDLQIRSFISLYHSLLKLIKVSMNKYRFLVLLLIVTAAAILRLLPHPPNFTPIAAFALFSGVFFSDRKYALAVPLLVLLVTDLLLGWHQTVPFVYGAFLLIVLLGRTLRQQFSILSIAGGGFGGSLLFFFVTNFGSWVTGTLYPKTWEGLFAAYVAGIPFLLNMILGTLFYCTLFFGVFILLEKTIPSIREQTAPSH
jgi:hypothetical protein